MVRALCARPKTLYRRLTQNEVRFVEKQKIAMVSKILLKSNNIVFYEIFDTPPLPV